MDVVVGRTRNCQYIQPYSSCSCRAQLAGYGLIYKNKKTAAQLKHLATSSKFGIQVISGVGSVEGVVPLAATLFRLQMK